MPPTYEKTEYAEISQFLRAPVKTDEETKDESRQDDRSSVNQEESSPDENNTDRSTIKLEELSLHENNTDNSDERGQEILLEI